MKVLMCFDTQLLAEGIVKLLQQLDSDLSSVLARPDSFFRQQLFSDHFDLLLLDVDSYPEDATALLMDIKKRAPLKKVMFVYEKFDGDLLKAYRNGLDGCFYVKDGITGILAALGAVLKGEVHIPQAIILNILCDGFVFTDVDTRLNQLTKREITVLEKIATESSMKAAAQTLRLAPSTLSAHKQRIIKKLGLRSGQEFNSFVRAFANRQKSPTGLGEAVQ
jgi:two-component system, NarL family, invasion response regulator UvrY